MKQARLKQLLEYEPTTGLFRWREHRGNVAAGQIAGCDDANGYRTIRIDKRIYLAHRLAWLYINGQFPSAYIDHVNGDPSDNRIANLRCATRSENMRNRKHNSNNTSGFKGVSWNKSVKKWQAAIRLNGKRHHLGVFDTADAAYKRYCEASKVLHGEFGRI